MCITHALTEQDVFCNWRLLITHIGVSLYVVWTLFVPMLLVQEPEKVCEKNNLNYCC